MAGSELNRLAPVPGRAYRISVMLGARRRDPLAMIKRQVPPLQLTESFRAIRRISKSDGPQQTHFVNTPIPAPAAPPIKAPAKGAPVSKPTPAPPAAPIAPPDRARCWVLLIFEHAVVMASMATTT